MPILDLDKKREWERNYYHSTESRRTSLRTRDKAVRERNRAYIKQYLSEHPCIDCGMADTDVLDFDHIRGVKRSNVIDLAIRYSSSLETLDTEIAKCEIRCANCHRKVTKVRRAKTTDRP